MTPYSCPDYGFVYTGHVVYRNWSTCSSIVRRRRTSLPFPRRVLYNVFHDLIHVCSPGAWGIKPQGDIVLMSTETSCHFGHLLLVSNHRWQIVSEKFIVLPFSRYKSMGKKSRSMANNSKMKYPIRPKFELVWAFMSVLVTCKYDKDPIKCDWEKLDIFFFFHRSRARNSKRTGQLRPKLKPVRDFMAVVLSFKCNEDWIHSNWEKRETPFPPFKVNGNAQGRISP